MTEAGRYLRGFGLSLLVHGVLVGTAFWMWSRPPPKPKPEPTRWEVNLFKTAELPPPPVVEDAPPPEADPEPSMGDLTPPPAPPAPASPDQAPAFAAPSFDMPKLALPAGGPSIGAMAIPTTGLTGGGMGPPTAGGGGGSGGRALVAPGFGGGGAGLSPIVRIPPTYPIEARRKKIEGWVRVEMTVLENGSVTDVKVRKAEPAGVFEQAAIAAIAQWRFSPATENGKPTRRRAGQTLKFELDK
ncbi:energy transducer TonB [Methylomagnum sp.]